MASLGWVLSVLLSLLNPLSYLLAGHDPFTSWTPADKRVVDQKAATALFVFGDSLFDIGNNQYLNTSARSESATYWPYGETFFHLPTGRFSDGRLVPDFIRILANLSLSSPFLQPGQHNFMSGTNFASAAGCVLPESNLATINLPTQLNYLKDVKKILQQELGDEETKSLLEGAVYFFSIGSDDYFSFYGDHPDANETVRQVFVGRVIDTLKDVLQDLYDLGGRKVSFQNSGPLGCTPSAKQNSEISEGCNEEMNSFAELHNPALGRALKELASQNSGFKYSVFDYYTAISDRLKNPAKYGFINSSDACCGEGAYRGSNCGNKTEAYELCSDPEEYLWFDGDHTGEKANLQLAKLIWSGTPNVTWPYNVQQLFLMN